MAENGLGHPVYFDGYIGSGDTMRNLAAAVSQPRVSLKKPVIAAEPLTEDRFGNLGLPVYFNGYMGGIKEAGA